MVLQLGELYLKAALFYRLSRTQLRCFAFGRQVQSHRTSHGGG